LAQLFLTQLAIKWRVQVPTSPNICFYTTWGKQNKRNMHWNEQQTSTNWRL